MWNFDLFIKLNDTYKNLSNLFQKLEKEDSSRGGSSSLKSQIENIIKEYNLLINKVLVVPIPKSVYVEKNLTGLIANQLMAQYQRPVLLLNEV